MKVVIVALTRILSTKCLSRLSPQTFLYVSLPSYLVTISFDRQISLGVWKNFQLKSGDLTKNGVSNDSSL